MKNLIIPVMIALGGLLLFGGCVASVGGPKTTVNKPTVGQQLVDLQNARNVGAINDAEFQQQKAKLLEQK